MELQHGTLLLLLCRRADGAHDSPTWEMVCPATLAECYEHLEACDESVVLLDEASSSALGRAALEQLEARSKGPVLPALGSRLHVSSQRLSAAAEHFVVDSLQEFRTPVTVILEFAGLLCEAPWIGPLNERQRDYLARIRGAASSLVRRIEDFRATLHVQRWGLTAGREEPTLTPLLARLAQRAAARGLALEVELPGAGLVVTADAVLLERALEALAEWACSRGAREGAVRLGVGRVTGSFIELELAYPTPTPSEQDIDVLRQGTVVDGVQRKSVTKLFGVGVELARATALALGGQLDLAPLPAGGGCFSLRLPRKSVRLEDAA